MALGKAELFLLGCLRLFQQPPYIPQSPGPLCEGFDASFIKSFERMLVQQSDQSDDTAQADRPSALQQASRPLAARRAQLRSAFEPIVLLLLERTLSASKAQAFTEPTGLQTSVQGNLFPALIK